LAIYTVINGIVCPKSLLVYLRKIWMGGGSPVQEMIILMVESVRKFPEAKDRHGNPGWKAQLKAVEMAGGLLGLHS
jgi:hypothetical protein